MLLDNTPRRRWVNWGKRRESNPRVSDPQSDASVIRPRLPSKLVGPEGVEPSPVGLKDRCAALDTTDPKLCHTPSGPVILPRVKVPSMPSRPDAKRAYVGFPVSLAEAERFELPIEIVSLLPIFKIGALRY